MSTVLAIEKKYYETDDDIEVLDKAKSALYESLAKIIMKLKKLDGDIKLVDLCSEDARKAALAELDRESVTIDVCLEVEVNGRRYVALAGVDWSSEEDSDLYVVWQIAVLKELQQK